MTDRVDVTLMATRTAVGHVVVGACLLLLGVVALVQDAGSPVAWQLLFGIGYLGMVVLQPRGVSLDPAGVTIRHVGRSRTWPWSEIEQVDHRTEGWFAPRIVLRATWRHRVSISRDGLHGVNRARWDRTATTVLTWAAEAGADVVGAPPPPAVDAES